MVLNVINFASLDCCLMTLYQKSNQLWIKGYGKDPQKFLNNVYVKQNILKIELRKETFLMTFAIFFSIAFNLM
jgi:hypothetical protein